YDVADCGVVLCVDGPSSLSAVDPASGALLWSTGPWEQVAPLSRGRLLFADADGGVSASIVDARTRRSLLALPRWYPVDMVGYGRPVLARDEVGLRTWFGVLDRQRLRVLGVTGGVLLPECAATDRYLLCPDVQDRLRVWRYAQPISS